jgi:hypothetical protein
MARDTEVVYDSVCLLLGDIEERLPDSHRGNFSPRWKETTVRG